MCAIDWRRRVDDAYASRRVFTVWKARAAHPVCNGIVVLPTVRGRCHARLLAAITDRTSTGRTIAACGSIISVHQAGWLSHKGMTGQAGHAVRAQLCKHRHVTISSAVQGSTGTTQPTMYISIVWTGRPGNTMNLRFSQSLSSGTNHDTYVLGSSIALDIEENPVTVSVYIC